MKDFSTAKTIEGLNHLKEWGCGIYFLMRGGVVVYVGKSTCMLARVLSHYRPSEFERFPKQFDSVAYLEYPESELTRVEREWIAHFLPVYNQCGYSNKMRRAKASNKAE